MVQQLSIIAIAQILVISKLSAQGKMVRLRRKVFHIHSNIFCLLRKVAYSYEYFLFIAEVIERACFPHHPARTTFFDGQAQNQKIRRGGPSLNPQGKMV